MAYNYSKLLGRIIEKFGSRAAFARAVNMPDSMVSRKLNNKSKLTQDEIELWRRVLQIPEADAFIYFFTPCGQCN